MARTIHEPPEGRPTSRFRYPELVRPDERRHTFHEREAQRYLRRKESRWAPIAYAIFLAALLSILSVAYTSYAFSKYRGEVLPGVYVDHVPLSGLSQHQAALVCTDHSSSNFFHPLRLTYNALSWVPKPNLIGLAYGCNETAALAMDVGRKGSFFSQLLDRLPLHPSHEVPLVFKVDDHKLLAYVENVPAGTLSFAPLNASLRWQNNRVVLTKSVPGRRLDVQATVSAIHSALGYLTQQTVQLPVNHPQPAIRDSGAQSDLNRVNAFLDNPPVIAVAKHVFVMHRSDFSGILSFVDKPKAGNIQMTVDSPKVAAYVDNLATTQINRFPHEARINFFGGHVTVVRKARNGRQLDVNAATTSLLNAIKTLKPHARLRWSVAVTTPPVNLGNPADLGISSLLGEGRTTFVGASTVRGGDIQQIASYIDKTLIRPNQDISFNTIVGGGPWTDRMYADQMQEVGGRIVPGDGGGMQQMATTFLRALYNAGLTLTEIHHHTYRLPWYEPPFGLEGVVSPARSWDLTFHNNTGKYLILQTRYEPVQQAVYVYLYGPKLGWSVTVDGGKVRSDVPPPPKKVYGDPTLAPDAIKHVAYPLDGGSTVVQRLVTKPNGAVTSDTLETTYQPRQAIDAVGSNASEPTATSLPKKNQTPGAKAGPTPTFSH
jgi:vancomycin resistance protein YoaR